MAQFPYQDELQIFPLTERYKLVSFNSKSEELNDFLINNALKDQQNMMSTTYLCYWKETLVGFTTLLTDTIEVKVIPEIDGVAGCPYKKYPAIKIGRFAVDRKFERNGIGSFLLKAAIGRAIALSKEIGCRYITVDSKHDSIVFYKKHEFKVVESYKDNEYPKMYLNMHPVITKMQPKQTLEQFEKQEVSNSNQTKNFFLPSPDF